MTPEAIRESFTSTLLRFDKTGSDREREQVLQVVEIAMRHETAEHLATIAGELKQMNQYLAKLAGVDPNEPKECREKTCSYFAHYLAYGPADLTHEGFHAAEKLASEHMRSCTRNDRVCNTCTSHEQRLRA